MKTVFHQNKTCNELYPFILLDTSWSKRSLNLFQY